MKQYEMYELIFQGAKPEKSEASVNVNAVFSCNGEEWNVKGFYDGNGIYKVRFLPQKTGSYTWKVTGEVFGNGMEECVVSERSHGFVQVEGNHFKYQDGERYIPFGTTVYALIHQPEELIIKTFDSLKKAPFNKIRYCIFPKSYEFNHNDPLYYPFEKDEKGSWNVNRPSFEYWKNLEKCIGMLENMGIQSDLILFHSYDRWGFADLSREEVEIYLDYAMRRLSAYPSVWWSMANEYDFMFQLKTEDWHEIEKIISEKDIYHHLLSNHNGVKIYDFSRKAITHCSIQTNAMHKVKDWWSQYQKPVMIDECCYEGNIEKEWGNISAFEMVNRFWKVYVQGGFATHGETYFSEDEILWWSKGGILRGESPARIAFLKQIMYEIPGALELWSEPYGEEAENTTDASEQMGQLISLFQSLSIEEAENLKWKMAAYTGHYQEDAYIKYFGEHCPCTAAMCLPKKYKYKIEVIDVWEMTRITLEENVSGNVRMKLPGKEGIALLAERIEYSCE